MDGESRGPEAPPSSVHSEPMGGKPYMFGVLADAQALGDFETLQSLGKRIIRLHSSRNDLTTMSDLIGKVVQDST